MIWKGFVSELPCKLTRPPSEQGSDCQMRHGWRHAQSSGKITHYWTSPSFSFLHIVREWITVPGGQPVHTHTSPSWGVCMNKWRHWQGPRTRCQLRLHPVRSYFRQYFLAVSKCTAQHLANHNRAITFTTTDVAPWFIKDQCFSLQLPEVTKTPLELLRGEGAGAEGAGCRWVRPFAEASPPPQQPPAQPL